MAVFDVVFEGGGAKGSAFVGALTALKSAGHSTRRLIGTSAGAITAALLAAGFSAEEMLNAVNEKLPDGKPRFASFMDHPRASDFSASDIANSETAHTLSNLHIPLGGDLLHLLLQAPAYPTLFSIVECGGVFAGSAFVQWLIEKLATKGMVAADTLASTFRKTNVDLSLVASDTTDREMLVLNHRTAPDVPLIWAVRMSMSIPFVWREVVWQQAWGTYQGRPKTDNIIVDGGVLSNFPIKLISDSPPEFMGDPPPPALNLGLLLDEEMAIPGTSPAPPPNDLTQMRVVQRISRLVDTMMGAQDNEEMRQHKAEICRLPVKGYGTTEFNMPQAKLQALVDGGRQAMVSHLASLGPI